MCFFKKNLASVRLSAIIILSVLIVGVKFARKDAKAPSLNIIWRKKALECNRESSS